MLLFNNLLQLYTNVNCNAKKITVSKKNIPEIASPYIYFQSTFCFCVDMGHTHLPDACGSVEGDLEHIYSTSLLTTKNWLLLSMWE